MNTKIRIIKICENCKNEFNVMPCMSHKRFCSNKCSSIIRGKNLRRGFYLPCPICNRPTYISLNYTDPNSSSYGKLRFCSRICNNKWKSINNHCFSPFKKGYKTWNKGIKMSVEFRKKCSKRAKEQWRDLDFREKQMKRDNTNFINAGKKALKNYYPNAELSSKAREKKFLIKVGVIEDSPNNKDSLK